VKLELMIVDSFWWLGVCDLNT